jgi:hypothetical protein
MKRPDHSNGNRTSAREAVLLVAALADIGVTGALGLLLTLGYMHAHQLGNSCLPFCATVLYASWSSRQLSRVCLLHHTFLPCPATETCRHT